MIHSHLRMTHSSTESRRPFWIFWATWICWETHHTPSFSLLKRAMNLGYIRYTPFWDFCGSPTTPTCHRKWPATWIDFAWGPGSDGERMHRNQSKSPNDGYDMALSFTIIPHICIQSIRIHCHCHFSVTFSFCLLPNRKLVQAWFSLRHSQYSLTFSRETIQVFAYLWVIGDI